MEERGREKGPANLQEMKDEERGEHGKRMDGRGWVGNGKKKENTKRTAVE